RGGAPRRGDHPAAPAAGRHHRPLLPERAVRSRAEILGLAALGLGGLALLFGLPHVVEIFALVDISVFVILSTLALSLALVWGFGGILCFGQSAFFGLGGYAYAIAVLHMGESTVPALLGTLLPMLFAALP